MPRHARILSKSQTYHVMLRGNNKENIFANDEDKSTILYLIKEKKIECGYSVFAYCVMDNHIHLVIKEGIENLFNIIKKIAVSYAYYYNKKYKRIGHVFQDRYRSENIEDDKYLLTVIRYIHQNPLKAGINTIEGYKWSSFTEYITKKSYIIDAEDILSMFSSDTKVSLNEFVQFNHENTKEEFLDVEDNCEIDETNVKEFINHFLKEKNISLNELNNLSNKEVRKELLEILHNKSNFSIRKIAMTTGLNREMVRRMIVSKEPSPWHKKIEIIENL